jgi:hypothetical protein
MRAAEMVTAAPRKSRESGLDTSNGLGFVQQRIGLFAKIIALIALAFLIAGAAQPIIATSIADRLRAQKLRGKRGQLDRLVVSNDHGAADVDRVVADDAVRLEGKAHPRPERQLAPDCRNVAD